jgi:predicted O-methyltransferase YrrM
MIDDLVSIVLSRLEAETASDDPIAPPDRRSLQIPPSTGALLFALCAGRRGCRVLEIGGSRGYSTIWLGAAARLAGGHVTSLERDELKLGASTRNISEAGLAEWVEVVPGNAFDTIPVLGGPFDVVFLDAWKDDYEALFALVRPLLGPGATIVADNVASHASLAAYSAARQADRALVSVTVPIDNGLEVSTCLTAQLHSV